MPNHEWNCRTLLFRECHKLCCGLAHRVAIECYKLRNPESEQSGEKQQRTEWHNIVAWRKLAEICGQYLNKGKLVYIEGRLQTRSWEDKEGNKRYTTEVQADNMVMLSARTDEARQEKGVAAAASSNSGFEAEITDDDVPF